MPLEGHMKRFVITTASALFLLAGTAAASVPAGPGVRAPHSSPLSPAANPKAAHRLSPRAAAAAATPTLFMGLPADGYAAYGTASVIHTDLLQVGEQRLENLDAAFSGASFSSAPVPQIANEMARIV